MDNPQKLFVVSGNFRYRGILKTSSHHFARKPYLFIGCPSIMADLLSNIQVLKLCKSTKEDVLQDLSNAVIRAGYAKPGFYEAILEREESYPTGLHTPGFEIAIPHADAEWTIESSLTIGILNQPVVFQPMGGEGGEVKAKIVFMLTIKDPSQHLDFLKAFSSLMEDSKNTG